VMHSCCPVSTTTAFLQPLHWQYGIELCGKRGNILQPSQLIRNDIPVLMVLCLCCSALSHHSACMCTGCCRGSTAKQGHPMQMWFASSPLEACQDGHRVTVFRIWRVQMGFAELRQQAVLRSCQQVR
jgi:hypothetical protein